MEIYQYSTTIDKIANLKSAEDFVLPSGVNMILNDIGADQTWMSECASYLKPEIFFLESEFLSNLLTSRLTQDPLRFYDKSIAVLYPKYGALKVKNSLNLSVLMPSASFAEFEIPTTRTEPNTTPQVELPTELVADLKKKSYDSLIIVDDVIVTGNTLNEIQNEVYRQTDIVDDSAYYPDLRFSWLDIKRTRIPANWFACSWLSAARTKDQRLNLAKFVQIDTGIYYKGQNGQPPLNSLSTWVYDENKGEKVLQTYAAKYAQNPEQFLQFIFRLKGGDLQCK